LNKVEIKSLKGYYIKGLIIASDFNFYSSNYNILNYEVTRELNGLNAQSAYSQFRNVKFISIDYYTNPHLWNETSSSAFVLNLGSDGFIESITCTLNLKLTGKTFVYAVYAPIVYTVTLDQYNIQDDLTDKYLFEKDEYTEYYNLITNAYSNQYPIYLKLANSNGTKDMFLPLFAKEIDAEANTEKYTFEYADMNAGTTTIYLTFDNTNQTLTQTNEIVYPAFKILNEDIDFIDGVDFHVISYPFLPAYPFRYKCMITPQDDIIWEGRKIGSMLSYNSLFFIKHLSIQNRLYHYAKRWVNEIYQESEEIWIISYTPCSFFSNAIIKLKKKYPRIKYCTIVADLVDDATNPSFNLSLPKLIQAKREQRLVKQSYASIDKFILLSKYMEEKIPPAKDNNIIIEGLASKVDSDSVKIKDISALYSDDTKEY
jgi:hypothetical protein